MKSRNLAAVATLSLLCILSSGAGMANAATSSSAQKSTAAKKLKFAMYLGPQAAESKTNNEWGKLVAKATGGRITVQQFTSGALMPIGEVLSGVAQKRADIGATGPSYNPAELPLSTIVSIPFLAPNAEAQSLAFQELYQTNKAFRSEWERNGVHVLFFYPQPPSILGTETPVKTLGDLKGKRIRALGYAAQAIAAIGATPVSIAGPDTFDAMQHHVIDGYISIPFEGLRSYGLDRVTKYITNPGVGGYFMFAAIMNLEEWNALSKTDQEAIAHVSQRVQQEIAPRNLAETGEAVCKIVKNKGTVITALPADQVDKWKKKVESQFKADWLSTQKDKEQADQFYQAYVATVKKITANNHYVASVDKCMK